MAMLKSHSRTLALSHSLSLDMLNNFCFHVYAQKSLFIGEIGHAFFDISIHIIITRACDIYLGSLSWFPAKNLEEKKEETRQTEYFANRDFA